MRTAALILTCLVFLGKNISAQTTWSLLPHSGIPSSAWLTSVAFANKDTGYVTDEVNLYRTTNGGTSWSLVGPNMGATFIYFYNNMIGYLISNTQTNGSRLFKTTNAGITWTLAYSFPSSFVAYGVHFPSLNIGYVCGSGTSGSVYKTTNGGVSFTPQTAPADYYRIHFASQDTGYAIGDFYFAAGAVTYNGGATWNAVTLPNSTAMLRYDVFALDNNTAVSVAYAGKIDRTSNAGVNWSVVPTFTGLHLWDVHFLNQNDGYISGGDESNSGVIMQSMDGGQNWFTSLATTKTLYSMSFPAPGVGYAVGQDNTIYKFPSITTSIEESGTSSFSVYPAISSGEIMVLTESFAKEKDVTLSVYGLDGKLVYSETINEVSPNIQLNLSALSEGIYIIRLSNIKESHTQKVIIKK